METLGSKDILKQVVPEDFRQNGVTMSKTAELVSLLIKKGYTISFAESCTGGKMAAAIVDIADASKVLNASFITYSNEAKMKYAAVSGDTLEKYGAVSEQTAEEMAAGTAAANNADVAVGITGIAGPTGGTKEKPVGTVCFGYYLKGRIVTETMHFSDKGRNIVRDMSVMHVTERLIRLLSEEE
jgi:PncC family amidohydrolase